MRSRLLCGWAAGLATLMLLSGCSSKEGTFATIGGAACGIAASTLGKGNSTNRAIRGLLGGGACAVIGGAIGRMLDEQDRQRMQQATYAVLRRPVPPGYYQAAYYQQQPASYGSTGYNRRAA